MSGNRMRAIALWGHGTGSGVCLMSMLYSVLDGNAPLAAISAAFGAFNVALAVWNIRRIA